MDFAETAKTTFSANMFGNKIACACSFLVTHLRPISSQAACFSRPVYALRQK